MQRCEHGLQHGQVHPGVPSPHERPARPQEDRALLGRDPGGLQGLHGQAGPALLDAGFDVVEAGLNQTIAAEGTIITQITIRHGSNE